MLVILIEDLVPLDDTASAVYRAIARRLKGKKNGFVLYDHIAQELNKANYVIVKAILRLCRKGLISVVGGELRLLKVVDVITPSES